eukprot:345491-Pelagomonas_calceolata.AAC.1
MARPVLSPESRHHFGRSTHLSVIGAIKVDSKMKSMHFNYYQASSEDVFHFVQKQTITPIALPRDEVAPLCFSCFGTNSSTLRRVMQADLKLQPKDD